MARMRMLKPGFFTNELLADVPLAGRLLFQGLWCLADREGRLEDRPRRIKAEVLPYDDVDIEALLDELARLGFITRYTVGDRSGEGGPIERYIQVVNFRKHQSPHIKEAPSTIPAPVKHGASTIPAPPVMGNGIHGLGYSDNTHTQPSHPPHESRVRACEETASQQTATEPDGDTLAELKDETPRPTPGSASRTSPSSPPRRGTRPSRPPLAADVAELIEACPRMASEAALWERRVCELAEAGYSRDDLLAGVAAYRRQMSEKIPLTLSAFCRHAQRLIGDADGRGSQGPPSIVELDRRRDAARQARADEHARAGWELAKQVARNRPRSSVPGS